MDGLRETLGLTKVLERGGREAGGCGGCLGGSRRLLCACFCICCVRLMQAYTLSSELILSLLDTMRMDDHELDVSVPARPLVFVRAPEPSYSISADMASRNLRNDNNIMTRSKRGGVLCLL